MPEPSKALFLIIKLVHILKSDSRSLTIWIIVLWLVFFLELNSDMVTLLSHLKSDEFMFLWVVYILRD